MAPMAPWHDVYHLAVSPLPCKSTAHILLHAAWNPALHNHVATPSAALTQSIGGARVRAIPKAGHEAKGAGSSSRP